MTSSSFSLSQHRQAQGSARKHTLGCARQHQTSSLHMCCTSGLGALEARWLQISEQQVHGGPTDQTACAIQILNPERLT